MANVDGSNAVQLSKDDASEFASPAWLPDSQMILVSKKGQLPMGAFELWAFHIKGGAGVPSSNPMPLPISTCIPSARWRHPTASSFITPARHAAPGEFASSFIFPLSQIVRRNRATGEEDTITAAAGSAFRPVLSPDGTKLVYGTRFETETALKILDLQTG